MNIFFLHLDQGECAKLYVNSHVVKMILETCQLLCSAHHVFPKNDYKPPYKLTHKNHPSAIWTRESLANYKWLSSLLEALCKEYTYRYEKIHKCQSYLEELMNNLPDIPDKGFTPPRQAMPDQYKTEIKGNLEEDINNVIESYKQYIFFEKFHIFQWKKRDVPEFINEYKNLF
jgi:hypothetical protein